jgi:hypothetical protein
LKTEIRDHAHSCILIAALTTTRINVDKLDRGAGQAGQARLFPLLFLLPPMKTTAGAHNHTPHLAHFISTAMSAPEKKSTESGDGGGDGGGGGGGGARKCGGKKVKT